MSERILRSADIRKLYGISNSTLFEWIKTGKLPTPFKIVEGSQTNGWRESVIEAHLAKQFAVQGDQPKAA